MSRSSLTRGAAGAAVSGLLATLLVGCYVVPIDGRTGQPLPWPGQPHHSGGSASPIVVAPTPPPANTVMQARLYPVNESAQQAGMVLAQVTDHHSGRGSFSLSYRGQLLQGEATRVDGGYAGFGRIHEQVLGPAPRAWSGRRGVANAFGSGLSAQCEYVITGPSTTGSLGTGACVFSDGARYQLHFGQ
jgi:hypothetical protein